MKNFTKAGITLSLLVFSFTLFAQKKITEGTISYDIVINTGDSKPGLADMFDGATSIVYIKGDKSRSEMISSLGTQSTLIDSKTGNVTILKEYGEQKYMINLSPVDWKDANQKYEGIMFTPQDEFTTIAGYKAQKAIGKLKDGTQISVFYTKDLVPVNYDFQYAYNSLPGLALQYESIIGDLKITYTVSKINFSPVPASKFDLPKSGFRVMTYSESKNAGK